MYLEGQWSERVFDINICLIIPDRVDSLLLLHCLVELLLPLHDPHIRVTGSSSVHGYQLTPTKNGHLNSEVGTLAQDLFFFFSLVIGI